MRPVLGQSYDLRDFVKTTLPKQWSDDWYRINNGGKECKVEIVDGRLRVSKLPVWSGVTPWAIGQDSLLCVNYGEFGGGIFYKPADPARRKFFVNGQEGPSQKAFFGGLMIPPTNPVAKRLKDYLLVVNGNINRMFYYKDSVYYFTGYTVAQGKAFGNIASLDLRNGMFTLRSVAKLNDNPVVECVDGDRLWIVTEGGALLKYENGQVTEIFGSTSALFPNSMVADGKGMLYVGLRGGYLAVDVTGKEYSFYEYRGH